MKGTARPGKSTRHRGGIRRLAAAVTVALLPVAIFLLDIPPGALAGCGTYGYACTQSACFRAEISTNQGYTWQAGSAWVYGPQGTSIDLYVRTTMSSTVNSIEGWSMGLKHTAPTLIGINGGNLYLKAASSATGSNSISTLLYGNPPDFLITRAWDCGQTQGVAIDYDATHYTTGPNNGLVTTLACYRLTFPYNSTVHQITLDFTDDVGIPAVKNLVVRSGQSLVPCKDKLTINVLPTTSYSPTQSYCPYSQMSLSSCDAQGGGGGGVSSPGMDFRRGDVNGSETVDVTDAVQILGYLFLGMPSSISCMDAADANDDEVVHIADPVFLLAYLFFGGAPPPTPGVFLCGPDINDNDVSPGLTCSDYAGCGVYVDSDGDQLSDYYETHFRLDENEELTELDPLLPDTDGDLFTDGQEVLPILVPGCAANTGFQISTPLNKRTADPRMKDIFVEIDFLNKDVGAADDHHHHPIYTSLEFVENQFKNKGINLHFDIGPPFPLGSSQEWQKYNLGNTDHQIVETNTLATTTLAEVKNQMLSAHFDDTNRHNVFHYCVFAHSHMDGPLVTGEAEQPSSAPAKSGRVFFITLGSAQQSHPSFPERINLMHELGHNLGLYHGGFEQGTTSDDPRNFKPNYRSVMGYLYSQYGIDVDGNGILDDFVAQEQRITYSNQAIDLDENNLDENTGLTGVGPAVNFNCTGDADETGVQKNIQCRDWGLNGPLDPPMPPSPECDCPDNPASTRSTLLGFDDWNQLLNSPFPSTTFSAAGCGGGGGGSIPEHVVCYTTQ